jgi:hypothetical protein
MLGADGIERIRRFKFPMVTGFILDAMHLIDGGVIKDFLRNLVGLCTSGRAVNALGILPMLNETVLFWKDYNLNEQARFMRLVAQSTVIPGSVHFFFIFVLIKICSIFLTV